MILSLIITALKIAGVIFAILCVFTVARELVLDTDKFLFDRPFIRKSFQKLGYGLGRNFWRLSAAACFTSIISAVLLQSVVPLAVLFLLFSVCVATYSNFV